MKEKHNKISYNHKDMEKISDTVLVVGKKKKKSTKNILLARFKKKKEEKAVKCANRLGPTLRHPYMLQGCKLNI